MHGGLTLLIQPRGGRVSGGITWHQRDCCYRRGADPGERLAGGARRCGADVGGVRLRVQPVGGTGQRNHDGEPVAHARRLVVGALPATVPDLHGDSIAQAGQALNAAGLVFGSVSYAVDYTCTNIGTVTWQSPAAGTRVNRGAAVSVRIATAPRPPRECL